MHGQETLGLYVPEAPGPLLERDLLSKLDTTVSMDLGLPDMNTLLVLTLEVSLEKERHIHTPRDNKPFSLQPFLDHLMKQFPGVWDKDRRTGLATGHPPKLVTIKPGANLVHQRQYPIPLEAHKGIAPHIQHLWDQEILREVQSAWNTPLLSVKKPGSNDYRPVQDLCWVNEATETIHPVIPNPYTLLSLIPPTARAFTCLDLKDAFFCLQLSEAS
jgi:hypothetical protein